MKSSACLVVAMCAVFVVPSAWAESTAPRHHHQGRHGRHAAPAPSAKQRPAPTAESDNSRSGTYAHPGDGDNDGLSRDPDDCNKGCIDGNPG